PTPQQPARFDCGAGRAGVILQAEPKTIGLFRRAVPMPADPTGPSPQPAWKGEGAGRARRGPQYAWKPDGPAVPKARRVWPLMLLLGAVACAALIVVLVKLLQPPPRAGLALVAADPAPAPDRLDAPLDPAGWLGGTQLAQWAADATAGQQSRWGKTVPEVL